MRKLLNFVKEAKAELKKVEWPEKDEVVNTTIVVLISIFVISMGLWAMDIVLTFFIRLFLGAS